MMICTLTDIIHAVGKSGLFSIKPLLGKDGYNVTKCIFPIFNAKHAGSKFQQNDEILKWFSHFPQKIGFDTSCKLSPNQYIYLTFYYV